MAGTSSAGNESGYDANGREFCCFFRPPDGPSRRSSQITGKTALEYQIISNEFELIGRMMRQSKQSPVEELLKQADQLISNQRPRAEVYAAMAQSLGQAWKDLNAFLEQRRLILELNVAFHR